jgi:hypothetical protein
MLNPKIVFIILFISGAELKGEIMPPEDEAVDVIVILDTEASKAARGADTSAQARTAANTIEQQARQFGATLRPQHPDTDDPDLSGYFVLAVPSDKDAGQLVEELLGLSGVEGAYLKPQPAMP